MRQIALTGGIASGKSYVARRFAEAGVPVISADQVAREVVAAGTPALAAIRARFGKEVLHADGTLDRARLANVVFSDPSERRELEAITHPAIRAAIDHFFASQPSGVPFAVAEIPLLYEVGRERDFDAAVAVVCSPEQQIERLMLRDGLTQEQAERRLAAQVPLAIKAERADFLVSTAGTFAETDRQVSDLLAKLSRTAPG